MSKREVGPSWKGGLGLLVWLYPKCHGEPLEYFKDGEYHDQICLFKDHSGWSVENGLEARGGFREVSWRPVRWPRPEMIVAWTSGDSQKWMKFRR